jgi:hypothetical protein
LSAGFPGIGVLPPVSCVGAHACSGYWCMRLRFARCGSML